MSTKRPPSLRAALIAVVLATLVVVAPQLARAEQAPRAVVSDVITFADQYNNPLKLLSRGQTARELLTKLSRAHAALSLPLHRPDRAPMPWLLPGGQPGRLEQSVLLEAVRDAMSILQNKPRAVGQAVNALYTGLAMLGDKTALDAWKQRDKLVSKLSSHQPYLDVLLARREVATHSRGKVDQGALAFVSSRLTARERSLREQSKTYRQLEKVQAQLDTHKTRIGQAMRRAPKSQRLALRAPVRGRGRR